MSGAERTGLSGRLRLNCVALGALAVTACHEPAAPPAQPSAISSLPSSAAPALSAAPATTPTATGDAMSTTFDDDLTFLSKHGAVKVLSAANGARIAVSGAYQARVM